MKKLELTKDELEKLYYLPPKDVEKETEFQITYRMGRNSLVLELVKKIDEELTPHIEYYDNGNVRVKGQKNSKGQREGLWEWFFKNGNIHFRTPYKGGKEDGIEEGFYKNGNIESRTLYVEGEKNGIEEWFDEQGNIESRTPYKEGKEDGIEECFDEQGNITETRHWKDGELIEETKPKLTPYVEYHDNGNVYVKGQKNSGGQEEGIWEWFFENGNIRLRTPFKEGKEDGIEEWFHPNGNITKTRLWKDGKLIEITKPELTPYIKYHPNGNVYIKGQKNSKGQEEGLWEWFYEDGNIFSRAPYKGGEKEGIEEIFYENGNIRWRIPYKEGKADGIEEWFYPNGNIAKTRLWKDGKRIEETKPKPQPDPQLIDYMAMRYRHDFGFLDEKHKESIRTTMKQLWEEVVGLGFYKPKSK
jgi:antitoxin component YwqK of YwqJK toxin-antitoxin module